MLSGEIRLVHRRWRTQLVYAGRTHRTNAGRIAIDQVQTIAPESIDQTEALRAGKPDADAVRAALRGQPDWPVFQISFHLADDADPREELAARTELNADEFAELRGKLARLDRSSSSGPWTRQTLDLIAANPGLRAADLAELMNRERAPFKLDVRKLKNLGLTYSLEVGYRLAPRGDAYLRWPT